MLVGPVNNYGCLHISGEYGCDRRTADAQCRKTKLSIDQYVVEYQVDDNGCDTGLHGRNGLSALTQRTGIYLNHHERRKPYKHNVKILFSIGQCGCQILHTALPMKVHADELFASNEENHNSSHCKYQSHPQFIPEGIADSLIILLSKILRSKNTRT